MGAGLDGVGVRRGALGLGSADPLGWDELGAGGGFADPPAVGLVDDVVVVVAQQAQVVQVGGASVGPVVDVVGVAVAGSSSAAGEPAAFVPQDHRSAQGAGGGVGDPAEVEGFTSGAQNGGDDRRVAGQAAGRGRGDGDPEVGR